MSEKRKPTTRYQGERPPKRRQLTPPPPPTPAPKPSLRKEPSNASKEEIPSRLKDSQALPLSLKKQEADLSNADYQSIPESGVLAASVQQSRQRWMVDGIFERYWTKPSKKKGPTEGSNPAKETMVKIGTCSMIIEPHVFDITLYSVREPPPVFVPSHLPPPPPPLHSNTGYNPYQDHKTYQHPYNYGTHQQHQPPYQSNSSNLTLPPFREGFGLFSSPAPAPYSAPPPPPPPPPRPLERSQSRDTAPPPTPGSENILNDGERSPTDPVIQMLATRAASDHNLKALMKIVASGHATQRQLEDFQSHINELNNLIKSQQQAPQSAADQKPPVPQPPPPPQPQAYSQAPTPAPLHQPPPPVTISPTPYAPLPPASSNPIKTESQTPNPNPYSVPPPAKPAPLPQKSEIQSIVFDFSSSASGGGDRFLFPRHTILEFISGGTQVIASFLVTRNTAPADYPKSKNSLYYESVTMRLSASSARTLEPLARVVGKPEEVKGWMNGIFDKGTRAKEAFLVTRLSKEKKDGEVEIKEAPTQLTDGLIKKTYEAPNGLAPYGSLVAG